MIAYMFLAETVTLLAPFFASNTTITSILSILTLQSTTDMARVSQSLRILGPFLLGWCLVSIGGILRVSCFNALGKHFTYELSLIKGHQLVTTGPYNVVRHPSYLAQWFICLGGAFV